MVGPERFSKVALYIALAAALLGMLMLPSEAATATPRALLTIADGPVELLRGAARHAATEGLALADNDIVRTAAGTRVARIEFGDGRVLDLGPDTQLLLLSDAAAAAQGLDSATAVMVQGWAKLAVPAAVNAGVGTGARLAAPRLSVVVPPAGSALLRVEPDGDTLVFAESRGATLWQRAAPGRSAAAAAAEATLREGEVWARAATAATGVVSAGATKAALHGVPRALADTLPHRAARFEGRTLEATGGEALDARDLATWLRNEPALLAMLRPRQAALLREGARTRASLVARRPAAVAVAPQKPARSARETRVVAGLALRQPAMPLSSVPSLALEPTPLLATERVHDALPTMALTAPAIEPAPLRVPASRPARRAADGPVTAATTTAAVTDAPKRR